MTATEIWEATEKAFNAARETYEDYRLKVPNTLPLYVNHQDWWNKKGKEVAALSAQSKDAEEKPEWEYSTLLERCKIFESYIDSLPEPECFAPIPTPKDKRIAELEAQLQTAKIQHRNDDEYIKAIRDERDTYYQKIQELTAQLQDTMNFVKQFVGTPMQYASHHHPQNEVYILTEENLKEAIEFSDFPVPVTAQLNSARSEAWVSVEERLPEIDPPYYDKEWGGMVEPCTQNILVTDGKEVWEESFGILPLPEEITHWQYLPSPPDKAAYIGKSNNEPESA
jgi:hypothetical protein